MHTYEYRIYKTLKNYATMDHELKLGPLQPIEKYLLPLNPIQKLAWHHIIKSQLHSNIIWYYNEIQT